MRSRSRSSAERCSEADRSVAVPGSAGDRAGVSMGSSVVIHTIRRPPDRRMPHATIEQERHPENETRKVAMPVRSRRTPLRFPAGTCALLVLFGAAQAQSPAWRPEKTIEIVAPATPGGLHDITARSLQHVFQTRKLVEAPIVVV